MFGTFYTEYWKPQAGATRRNADEKFNRQICIGITSRKSRAPEPRPGAADTAANGRNHIKYCPEHRFLLYPIYLPSRAPPLERSGPRQTMSFVLHFHSSLVHGFEWHEKRDDYELTCHAGSRAFGDL